ncbi:MAG: LLM class flavin-dependent oxidoreductase [Acidimicrobiia bacterium]|nr:LLM class flavin-dependent oxidoreductase [Acidimicrobiia bacterium]MDH5295133.1 LLM class flavin-dependent oxidoreductase [Acidimicrobiia bacterium]
MIPSINIMPEAPVGRLVEVARAAERLGFRRCWVYDEGLAARDVFVVMTAIASATETMQIGTGITNPYTRHPAMTVGAVAALDELSGGRAFLGFGAGGSLTLDPLGIERARPLAAVREVIEASRALFGGGRVDHESDVFKLNQASLDHGRSDIEIWFAGRGPKMLTMAAECADGVMLEFIHRELLDSEIHRVLEAAGGRPLKLAYSTMVASDPSVLDIVRPHMTYRLVDSPRRVQELIGMDAQDVATVRSAMGEGLESAGRHILDEWIHPFVVHGSPDECAAELRRLESLGIGEFVLPIVTTDGAEELMKATSAVFERL